MEKKPTNEFEKYSRVALARYLDQILAVPETSEEFRDSEFEGFYEVRVASRKWALRSLEEMAFSESRDKILARLDVVRAELDGLEKVRPESKGGWTKSQRRRAEDLYDEHSRLHVRLSRLWKKKPSDLKD